MRVAQTINQKGNLPSVARVWPIRSIRAMANSWFSDNPVPTKHDVTLHFETVIHDTLQEEDSRSTGDI